MAVSGGFRATLRRLATAAGPSGVHLPKSATLQRSKVVTSITGLPVHPSPFSHLLRTYSETLSVLNKLPEGAVYRQATEALTKSRQTVVQKYNDQVGKGEAKGEDAVRAAEEELDQGLIEEVVLQADSELNLALKMLEYKGWEDLEVKPVSGQWEYFRVPPSNTNPTD